jgi:hypothetical protein
MPPKAAKLRNRSPAGVNTRGTRTGTARVEPEIHHEHHADCNCDCSSSTAQKPRSGTVSAGGASDLSSQPAHCCILSMSAIQLCHCFIPFLGRQT